MPECVGIIAGINRQRDAGTHYAQESVFKSCAQLATQLALSLYVYVADAQSLEKVNLSQRVLITI
eukprot:1024116-Pyramimonas_sp.AAC.2